MIMASQDVDIAMELIEGLLNFWPSSNSVKEKLLIDQLLELI